MSVNSFEELEEHVGHHVEVVTYGVDANVAIECEDCGEVLLDFDRNYAEFSEQG